MGRPCLVLLFLCVLELLASHLDELNLEHQWRVRLDLTLLTLAVSQLLRDVNFQYRACRHVYESLCPTLDNLIGTEVYSLTTPLAAVEYSAVDEATLVVYGYE